MKHKKIIILLAVIVTIVPFLGFPARWDNVIIPLLGSTLVIVTILSPRETVCVSCSFSKENAVFIENSSHRGTRRTTKQKKSVEV